MNKKLLAFVISGLMLVLLAPGLYIPVNAAQYWSDGFESGDKTAWSGQSGTVTVSTDHPYTGTYGATLSTGRDNNDLSKTQSYSELYFRCQYYFHDLTLPDETYSRFRIMSIQLDEAFDTTLIIS